MVAFLFIELVYRYGAAVYVPQLPGMEYGCLVFIALFLLWGGTLDDVKPVTWRIKFLLQFLLAGVVVGVFNLRFEHIHFLYFSVPLGAFSVIVSVLWLVAVMNALNIIDGVDGLAACVSIIGFITLAILAHTKGAMELVAVCIILAGITAGFLIHNFNVKSKTFLGDTGSLFLGTMLGLLCIQVTRLPENRFSILVPLLIVGYPIFDTSVAMIRRYTRNIVRTRERIKRKFLRMFEADNEHLHHRLVHWGLSHTQATFLLSMVAATMGSVAIIISRIEPLLQLAVFGYLLTCLILILNRLRYIGMRHWLFFPRIKLPRPKLVGVIEPEEVFFHSLKNYEQHKVEFINIPLAMSAKFQNQLSAIVIHNAFGDKFDHSWNNALRAAEVHDCPVFVIAEQYQLNNVNGERKNFKDLELVKKPVLVPELIDEIEKKASKYFKTGNLMEEPLPEVPQTHGKINV
ncbi:MraY family glycosyltransferase [Fibrobacterota bacterium]